MGEWRRVAGIDHADVGLSARYPDVLVAREEVALSAAVQRSVDAVLPELAPAPIGNRSGVSRIDRSGACVAIPSLLPGEKIPSSAKAVAYQVKEAYGLIWVSTSPLQTQLPEWPDDAWNRPDFKVFCTGQYV